MPEKKVRVVHPCSNQSVFFLTHAMQLGDVAGATAIAMFVAVSGGPVGHSFQMAPFPARLDFS